MADNFTYTWESLSEKDAATVKRCFGPNGTQELVRFFILGFNEISKFNCPQVKARVDEGKP